MVEVFTTAEFDRWLRRLKDRQGRLRIIERLDRLVHGHAGDATSVGQGVMERRLTYGPGYRVYDARRGHRVVLLLCGGETSTQQRDIARVRERGTGERRRSMMTETTDRYARFDAADYLDDLDDAAAYLQIAVEESGDDPTAVPRALGVIARSQNMSELARRVGMSRDGLYKALSDHGNPTWSTVVKVCTALGLTLTFRPAA